MREDLELEEPEFELACKLFRMGFPPLTRPQCLPYLFGVSHQFIGYMETHSPLFYRRYEVKKVGGGVREIEAPRRFLKIIQSWINEHIFSKYNLPDCVNGFVRGKSIFSNGRAHAGKGNLMVVDIKDFFPSVKFEQVEGIFNSIGYPRSVSYQLAALCCIEGRLPQGAPTSPAIANAVFKGADEELLTLAAQLEVNYTRYADDLAFSGLVRFDKTHLNLVEQILHKYSFSINDRKTRIIGRGGRQIVAGLVVNQKCLPPRSTRRNWRATFHRAENRPKEYSQRVTSLFGIAAFVNQFSPETANKYKEIASTILNSSKG